MSENRIDVSLFFPPGSSMVWLDTLGDESLKVIYDQVHAEMLLRKLITPAPVAPVVKPSLNDGAKHLIKTGNFIGAIKMVRESFPGTGLREAKDLCDAYRNWLEAAKKAGYL